jgi:[protein-PII] uridylyltransferase
MSTRERRERSNESDRFLSQLFLAATQAEGRNISGKEIALAAVGGYGRGELSPGSDLDILFLHSGKVSAEDLKAFVNDVLYPLWDKKSVDHSVRTRSETRDATSSDLRVATGLLDIRLIAGNPDLVAGVQLDALDFWRKNAKENLADLQKSLQARHTRAGELAYLLEPDLKEARGGLRAAAGLQQPLAHPAV